MPNNKGFTLVELLATVTIMVLITALAIPTSMYYINRGKENQINQVKSEIEQAADKYYRQHKDNIFSEQDPYYSSIELSSLIDLIDDEFKKKNDDGTISNKIVDPRNKNNCLTGSVLVEKSNDRVEFTYDVESISCN